MNRLFIPLIFLLISTIGCGISHAVDTESIEPELQVPMVNFTTNLTSGFVPFSVQFTDSSENANGWYWDFGDGNNSIEQNPIHTYTKAGKYTVTLTVSNSADSDTVTKPDHITASTLVTYTESYTFVTKWGSSGSEDGQFDYPIDVAVDSSGNVYVTYLGNNCIQKFDSNGAFITKWDSYGSEEGQLNIPEGIDVDSWDNVYVADYYNNCIQKFDSNGAFITKWGSPGTEDGQFNNPQGVAVDSSGNVYVTDTSNHRIQKFDSNGAFITKWGSYGSEDGQFDWPYSIAVDSSDNVYVTDPSYHRIQKFDSSGAFITKWDSYGSEEGQLNTPEGIDVDPWGNVYVADYGNDRIQKFDSNGAFITKWGSSGTEDGQFNYPHGVVVDSSGNVYVTDYNNRVQKFAPIETPEPPVPIYNPENGHYYELINVPEGITWEDAKNAAQSLSYSGMNGHLATITSQDENDFIVNNLNSNYHWLAGLQPDGSAEPDGGWQWITDETWDYANWDPAEPNEYGNTGEDRLQIYANGYWNDISHTALNTGGYIVEYEVSDQPLANFSSNVTSGSTPLDVQFTDFSENATEWFWDFGDGNNSIEQNPVNAYSAAGNHTIKLSVTNENGADSKLGKIIVLPVYAYITNSESDTVSIIDTKTNKVIATVPVGNYPYGVAVNPDGTKVYVTNYYSDTVSVVDTTTNTVIDTIPVGEWPLGIAVTPDGTKIYVANEESNTVSVVDTSINTITTNVSVGSRPSGIAVSPDGKKVYVGNKGDFLVPGSYVSVIDTATNTVIDTILVGKLPMGIAVTPDGTKVYVTNEGSNTVSVVDTVTNTVTATINVGIIPYGVAVNPDGTKVYVTNYYSDTVSVVDTVTNTVTATVDVGDSPRGVSVSLDGTKVYVANLYSNTISVIDTKTSTVMDTVNVGDSPLAFGQFIGFTLSTRVFPVVNFSSNITAGNIPLSVQFTDSSENANGWYWDFGDGTNSTEQNPIHTYSATGNYTANLTINNANGTNSKSIIISVLQPYAYVTNMGSNTVSVIDIAINKVVATVNVGIGSIRNCSQSRWNKSICCQRGGYCICN